MCDFNKQQSWEVSWQKCYTLSLDMRDVQPLLQPQNNSSILEVKGIAEEDRRHHVSNEQR